MSRLLRTCVVVTCLFGLSARAAGVASAQPPPAASSGPAAPAPKAAPQGIAVLGAGASRDAAHTVARAVYASRLRPTSLDEAHARVLAGDPPPEGAAQELRDLSELRAGVTGSDAASRKLLASIAEQLGVRAILVVQVERVEAADAGAPSAGTTASARLFLADVGDLDAARYDPEPGVEGPLAWRATVASLERRFAPAPSAPAGAAPSAATSPTPPPKPATEESGSKPFYASPWFWAAVGGAALAGGAIYFASRDTTSDTIHLQMRLPR